MCDWFEAIKIIVDLLKGMQWFAIAILITVVFQKELRDLLRKLATMKKWRKGDAELEFPDADQQKIEKKPLSDPLDKPLPGLDRNPARNAINELEIIMLNELAKNQDNDHDKMTLLIRLLAQDRLELHFERIHEIMFGSQIRWLRTLNHRGIVSVQETEDFFMEYKRNYPDVLKDYDFDAWIGFLINSELVRKIENKLEITDVGRYFLTYLTEMRRFEDKPF